MKVIEIKIEDGAPGITMAAFRLALKEAAGIGLDEEVIIKGPQFDRDEPIEILYTPTTKEEFDSLKFFSPELLRSMGLGLWEPGHYLYPVEWYDLIPAGYPVVDICGETEAFQPGVTDNDRRGGCLPYGFLKPGE